MKFLGLKTSFLVLFTIFCFFSQAQDMSNFEKGINIHKIVIPKNATAVDSLAAKELQYFVKLGSNARLSIVTDDKVRFEPIISIGKTKQSIPFYKEYGSDIQDDGFMLHTDKKSLYIIGNEKKSVLYGVYHYLENYLGFRMLDADTVFIDFPKDYVLGKIHDLQNPSFEYRETLYRFPNVSQRYADWHKLQNRADMNREWGFFVHSFNRLIPVNQYFESHSEWFSEINGRRIKDGQLCLSNPEVLEELCRNLEAEMLKKPDATIWSVSNNDNVNNCTCENCRKLDSLYGSPSGTLLYFINKVAERFPDKTISTLAYQYTRRAPLNIKPLPNVNIMFCSIECGRQLPFEENPSEIDFINDMKDWSALTDNIFAWDYVIQFRNMMNPFPNLHVIQPNLQFFKKNGVKMMFEQGYNGPYGEMMEWRTYLISKLLWDVNTDVVTLRNDFMNRYYGEAAPCIIQYIDLMQKTLLDSKMFLNIYGYPIDAKNSFLSPENIKQYQEFFRQAYINIGDNQILKDRVRRLELSLDFAVLDLAMSDVSEDLSYFIKKDGEKYLRSDMIIKANKFLTDSKRFGIKQLEEMGYPPDEFFANIMSYIEKSSQKNIASGKKVEILTNWSRKYDVGGESALTDDNYGNKDFHYNWLGFEGEHLDAIVDLNDNQAISQISIDFLTYPLAWIYLPEKVEFFVSSDKKNWEKIGEQDFENEVKLTKNAIVKAEVESLNLKTRYIRVKATSILENPSWHRGFGQPCWIFCDEILVR